MENFGDLGVYRPLIVPTMMPIKIPKTARGTRNQKQHLRRRVSFLLDCIPWSRDPSPVGRAMKRLRMSTEGHLSGHRPRPDPIEGIDTVCTDEVNEETCVEKSEGDCTIGDEGTAEFSEEKGEGEWNVGDEEIDGDEETDGDGNEGDEDSHDSSEECNDFTDFENDVGGLTQDDDGHINVDVQYEGENEGVDKGNIKSVKTKVKTTKAKASEVKEVEATALVIASVAALTSNTTSAPIATPSARRNKQRRRSGGFGVYINPNTGAQILNPGGRGQQVLSKGRNVGAAAKKNQ
nr:uncharacterized protein LOC109181378 [Ipomoea batatas]